MTATTAPDLRARKRKATHALLATTAFDLARRHGLDGFTLDDLTRAADVSRRTFFNHFLSKEEAVSEVVRVQVNGLLDEVRTGACATEQGHATEQDDTRHGPDDKNRMLGRVVHTLLRPESVATFRDLMDLTEAHPALLPHLARIQTEATEQVAVMMRELTARDHGVVLPAVYAYAVPGAVIAAVTAAITGSLHVVEIDGPAPGALTVDELVGQLLDLLQHSHPAAP